MKTTAELISDMKKIQSAVTTICQDLAELEASNQQQSLDVHISDFMQTARHYKIDGHVLGDTKDNLAVEAYFTLLFSVAMKNVSADCKTHPLLYPCRVAASFSSEPDMELYFKKSLVLDEKTIHQYIDAIQTQNLRDNFIIDALMMTATYDKGNLSKLDFIADLASLMAIEQDEMNEILMVVSATIEKWEVFEVYLNYVDFHRIIYYMGDCAIFMVTTPTDVYYYGNVQWYDSTDEQIHFSDKKSVTFMDINFSDVNFKPNNYYVFSLKNVQSVSFIDCNFTNVTNPLINFVDVQSVFITGCRFTHFSNMIFEFRKIVETACIESCQFSDCYQKTEENRDSLEYGGVIGRTYGLKKLEVRNCKFLDCRVKRRRSYGLSETTMYNYLFSGSGYSDRIHTEFEFKNCDKQSSCDYATTW